MARAGERSFLARLASNTAISFFGNAVQRGITFIVTLILARGLGGESFGLYSYVVAYMFLFAFLGDLGVERVVTREVSRTPQLAGELIGSALVIKVALSILAMIAAIATAIATGMERGAFICVVLAGLGMPMGVELVFRGYFQSRFQAAYTYAITLPGTLWFLVGTLVVTRFGLPVYALFAFGLAIAPLILAALFWVSHYRLGLRLRPSWSRVRLMLRDSIEVGGFIFLFMLAMRLDQVMLHHLSGDLEVGRYAVGVRLSEALALIPEALIITVFPLLASSEEAAPERFHHTYRLGFKYLSALGVLVAFGCTLLRHEMVNILFGRQYAEAATSLAILAWNMFFTYIGVIYLGLFVAQARQRLLVVVSSFTLTVNVVLNLALIPIYGASGAAAATLAASAAGFASWIVLRETRPYMLTCIAESWRAVTAALISGAILWAASLDGIAAAVALVLVYPLLLWALGGVVWSDVALLQRLFATQDPQTVR